jgi:hypothetical protein
MKKPTRETIRKRVATRQRNAAQRARKRKERLCSSMAPVSTPFERLERDGAHSTFSMQRRVKALAYEINIPPADFHKLMYKRPDGYAIHVFCEKYKVSYDWLLAGDLKGLRRMTQARQSAIASTRTIAHDENH